MSQIGGVRDKHHTVLPGGALSKKARSVAGSW
eukprot:SAG31_NODE_14514_length_802_cov_1.453770_1_plen_31_part_10